MHQSANVLVKTSCVLWTAASTRPPLNATDIIPPRKAGVSRDLRSAGHVYKLRCECSEILETEKIASAVIDCVSPLRVISGVFGSAPLSNAHSR